MLISLCNCTDLLFSTTCLSASSYILPVITSLLCSLLGINDIEIYILTTLLQWGYTTAILLVLTRKYPPETQVWQVIRTRRGFNLLAASKIGVRHDIEGGILPTASNTGRVTWARFHVHMNMKRKGTENEKYTYMGVFFCFGVFVLACPAVK